MIDWIQAFWLAVIQGFTEFLPISSSGHLALAPWLFGWRDQGLSFDVAVHVGTLIAVVWYFREDVIQLMCGWWHSIIKREHSSYSKLAWSILFATTFVAIAGVCFNVWIEQNLRNPIVIAVATIVFALVLWYCDVKGKHQREIESLNWKDVVVVGLLQVLALIPGTSRSGITISAGLLMGLTRQAAARFSFLMAIPVIMLSGLWQTKVLLQAAEPVKWEILIFATIVSALTAWVCIYWFLRFVQRFSMLPFVIYRLFLGAVILYLYL